jgi:hypothetical protein
MPDAWSQKDERQYDKIKRSATKSGKSSARAKEIAARTVNKRRSEEGRTESTQSRATGNPNKRLEDRSKSELYNRAKELKIDGRSGMSKAQLAKAIQQH